MATFTAVNATGAIRFDTFSIASLLAGTTLTNNTTTFTRGVDADNATTFAGTGFTYAGGLFNGGTITGISSVGGGQTQFTFGGMALSVSQFRAFASAGNSQGFLAAIFAGSDTLTGSAFDDYLRSYAGADSLEGGNGNDTLDGGAGIDSMNGGDGDDFYFVDNAKDAITDSSGTDSIQSTISLTLGAGFEHLYLAGTAALTGTGNALANQLVGNTGANKLFGLDGGDGLNGGDGNDTLDGGTGDDAMSGGAGNDVYFADNTSDTITESFAGKVGGIDTVFSSVNIALSANVENLTLTGSTVIVAQGNDLNNIIIAKNAHAVGANDLSGENGNDTIIGSADNDVLHGGAGADSLTGGNGNDELRGGLGADTSNGGAGDDIYLIDDADKIAETLAGAKGGVDSVTYQGTIGYKLGTNLENLNVQFSTGDTYAIGNNLANKLEGNDNANLLNGMGGADTMLGMDGNDTYVVDNALDRVDEQSGINNGGSDTVKSSVDFNLTVNGSTVLGDIEHLILLGKAVNGIGNGFDNVITGNASKNLLSGLAGADTLDGGGGADTMIGGDGNDIYVIDSTLDVVSEAGTDIADRILSSKVSVDISAVGAIEHIILSGKLALSATGNGADNAINGNDGANKLVGLNGNDTLTGGAGNDTLIGGDGADMFIGNAGNDTFIVDGADLFTDGYVNEDADGGIDTVISTATASFLPLIAFSSVENLVLAAGSSATDGIGNQLDNVITGNELDNILLGIQGNDTIDGGAGNDTIDGGSGNDLINGGAGNDSISGGFVGTDTIDGGAGDDTLAGGLDADVFIVSSGNDTVLFFTTAGPYLIKGFDGNSAGGQDVLDLDILFDNIPVDTADRASRVLILDHGATVDVLVNADGNLANGYELTVATIQTKDAVTVGDDLLLGNL